MTRTVIQHVLSRLHDIGVSDVFGVPGDYSFAVSDAVCDDPRLRWIGCCNELNAAYAADGYARIKGVAALSTTYGVGELSAINGVAGAYAEHLPVFHLVGTPNMATQLARAPMHHTFGNGEYDLFRRMSEPVVCAHAVMTPQNVAYETERLIAEALYHRRPVYMAFPADLANQPMLGEAAPIPAPQSDPVRLAAAAEAIVAALADASTACIVGGILVARTGQRAALQAVVDAAGLPFSSMLMGKSVLDEQHPAYIGIYNGALMNEPVRQFVEGCDRVLMVGAPMTDFNSGAFTARLDPVRTITIGHHHAQIDGKTYPGVEMGELLAELAKRLARRDWPRLPAKSLGPADAGGSEPIDAAALYSGWESFIKPGDIVVVETGTVSMGMGFALLPKGATFHNQTLWGSIGWATPAAFGAAIAAPDRHVVLITGEGAHQLTVQEIGQFGRHGLKPTIFVLNNDGYLIERLLCKDPAASYNDLAQWRYAELPRAFGNDGWLTARVSTCAEFDDAMAAARNVEVGAYIEVVTDAYAASPLAEKLHEAVKTLYKS
ncbi:alpha-keto acid decarboxylase family protein [Bosea caraganae]|uniref:Alpha-keto acid decarboxylase family protein n=1 Tax=Bosea caraganae TaxID=2763117 RepID=A0A370LBW9_9HYPH|nr:thiamine pyrophosphate-binding protein [Bosea caraganae]RDJ27028.1 alpha-keto acid decarboxylase family protein [Bosea caraganae]RDJ29045.1 alpha-keto acid decarboxylase family protein [Bosea caraganae]